VVVDFNGKRCQRRDGIDSAGAEQDEAGLVLAAVLEEVDGAAEVVIEEFLGTGLAIDSRQHAGIGSAIKDPVSRWKVGKILLVADVPHPDIDTECAEWLEIGLAPLADEAVDAGDLNAGKMLEKPAGDDGSGEATDTSDYNMH
jgi:hypothetical protein